MAFSEEDKTRISVHSLIGYCRSAKVVCTSNVKKKELVRWAEGLLEIAEIVNSKLEKTE